MSMLLRSLCFLRIKLLTLGVPGYDYVRSRQKARNRRRTSCASIMIVTIQNSIAFSFCGYRGGLLNRQAAARQREVALDCRGLGAGAGLV